MLPRWRLLLLLLLLLRLRLLLLVRLFGLRLWRNTLRFGRSPCAD